MPGRLRTVALLPLKANSQRVKGKNFRPLGGRPLFQWILQSLLAEPQIDQIVINTDARHLLEPFEICRSPRVLIRDRASDLRGDEVSMNAILADDIAHIPAQTYLMTHATNPFLSPASIRSALARYHDGLSRGADSLFTVNKVQTRFYLRDGTAVNHDPDNLIQTQDLEPWYEENSCLYLFSAQSFAETAARIGTRPQLMELPWRERIDIDTEDDWAMAEAVCDMMTPLAGVAA